MLDIKEHRILEWGSGTEVRQPDLGDMAPGFLLSCANNLILRAANCEPSATKRRRSGNERGFLACFRVPPLSGDAERLGRDCSPGVRALAGSWRSAGPAAVQGWIDRRTDRRPQG